MMTKFTVIWILLTIGNTIIRIWIEGKYPPTALDDYYTDPDLDNFVCTSIAAIEAAVVTVIFYL